MTFYQFEAKQAKMSDKELIEKCERVVHDTCETGTFTMSVPPSVNDGDMLLCELIKRYRKCLDQKTTV